MILQNRFFQPEKQDINPIYNSAEICGKLYLFMGPADKNNQ